jgi:hypothetical protein
MVVCGGCEGDDGSSFSSGGLGGTVDEGFWLINEMLRFDFGGLEVEAKRQVSRNDQ